MNNYEIIIGPDPRLSKVSEPVAEVTKEIRALVDQMIVILKATGAGLAAPQIGVLKRILVLDISSYVPENKELYVMINPEITYFSDEKWIAAEGCLSFPTIERVEVERPENIKLNYLDYNGKQCTISANGWFARGIQHELDHLNGITLLDYVTSKLKKDMYLKKLQKYKKHSTNS